MPLTDTGVQDDIKPNPRPIQTRYITLSTLKLRHEEHEEALLQEARQSLDRAFILLDQCFDILAKVEGRT